MIQKRFISLKYRLIAYFLVISLLPILLLGTISFYQVNRILAEQMTSSAMSMVLKTIENFDRSAQFNESILVNLNNSSVMQQYLRMRNLPELRRSESYERVLLLLGSELESVINNGNLISSVALLWNDGSNAMLRGSTFFNFPNDYRKLPLFQEAIKTTYRTIWQYFVEDDGSQYLCVARPLVDGNRNEVAGIIMITIFSAAVKEQFEDVNLGDGERNLVVDEHGRVIFDSRRQITGVELPGQAHKITDRGSLIERDQAGKRQYVTYATSQVTGWSLVNFVPYESIHESVSSVSRTSLMIMLLCIVYASLVAIYVYSSLYKPIKQISRSLTRFGEGDLEVRLPDESWDELGMLMVHFNRMAERIKELIANMEREQKRQKETEIRLLQSQIMPHFLHNTLTSIKALARMGRTKEISEMVVALLGLLRMVNNGRELVTLEEELRYVENYVTIMRFRYGNYFSVRYHIEEEVRCCAVPKLTLQPLVENCIIHAFQDRSKQYAINIRAYVHKGCLIAEVADNGVGMDEELIELLLHGGEQSKGKLSGIGLHNINDRIRLYDGEAYGLSFSQAEGGGTVVTVRLPLNESHS